MNFVVSTQFKVRKVFIVPNGEWMKREIVADFCEGPAGDLAYAAFKSGLAAMGAGTENRPTLHDDEGVCLVGDLGELTGA